MVEIFGAIFLASTVVIALVWLFFLVHAMQRLESPLDRTLWLLLFLLLTVLAIPLYIIFRYRDFLKQGQGALLRNRTTETTDSA